MARRKQKFRWIHLAAMAAIMIWLPALVGRLAGIPSVDSPDLPVPSESAPPIDAETISQVQQQDSVPEETSHIRPAPAGLILTETLVSASGKTAVINNLAFREGQMLNPTGYPFRVRSILAGRVILEGDGGLYELRRQSVFE